MKKYTLTSWAAIAACAATLNLTSCSEMAGMGIVSEKQSQFDGKKEVRMSPAVVVGTEFKVGYPLFGAHWSESSPNKVTLIIQKDSTVSNASAYSNIRIVEINVDGKLHTFFPRQFTEHSSKSYNSVSRTIHTSSRNAITVPLALTTQMVSADTCMIRTSTSSSVFVQNFAKESNMGTSTAKSSMRKFLARVNATR